MKLDELETGMVVTLRNGLVGVVINGAKSEERCEDIIAFPNGDSMELRSGRFDNEMNFVSLREYSIDRVEILTRTYDISNFLSSIHVKKKMIWERAGAPVFIHGDNCDTSCRKVMTLEDLKTGMIVTLRCGLEGVVIRDVAADRYRVGDIIALSNCDSAMLCSYDSEMNDTLLPDYSIDKVEILEDGDGIAAFFKSYDVKRRKIWERDNIIEVTMDDIERAFGSRVHILGC